MGVDQVVEVELVGADGSLIVANGELPNIWDNNYVASKGNGTSVTYADGLQTEKSEDSSLFWALRGGGAGPWGVVTALTIRLHKPRLFFSHWFYLECILPTHPEGSALKLATPSGTWYGKVLGKKTMGWSPRR